MKKIEVVFTSTVVQYSKVVIDMDEKFLDEDGNVNMDELMYDDEVREVVFDNIELISEDNIEWGAEFVEQ